jgi:hypothetical protein
MEMVLLLDMAGVIEYAIEKNCLIGGDDFKSGQTKMKSVLVDFLVGAGIKVCHLQTFSLRTCNNVIRLEQIALRHYPSSIVDHQTSHVTCELLLLIVQGFVIYAADLNRELQPPRKQ